MKILNIQKMSTEDGPGLRTTVFFKGCPLSCKWCHNPESISPSFQKEWIKVRCIGCRVCEKICPKKAITFSEDGIHIDSEKCNLCFTCVDQCPTGAMSKIGKQITVAELEKELLKDVAYYNGDGGVSLSGGEVLLQIEEVTELCRRLKEKGISIAIDTSGFAHYSSLERLLPYVDLFLYDLKIANPIEHKKFCGVDNSVIFENLKKLSLSNTKIWIRTPIIPGATDSIENITALATFLKDNNIRYERWELCAFNNLCRDKYARLHQPWDFDNAALMTREQMQSLLEVAQKIMEESDKVSFTGATRLEEKS